MAGAKAPGNRAILNRGLLIEIPSRIGISQQAQAIPNAISKYAITPFLFFVGSAVSAKELIRSLLLLQIFQFYEGRTVFNEVLRAPITGTAKKSKSFRAFAAQSAILSDVEAIFTPLVAVTTGRT